MSPRPSPAMIAFRAEALAAFAAKGLNTPLRCRQIPEWGESTNLVFPELQAAIVGDKTVKEALDDAAAAVDELMQRVRLLLRPPARPLGAGLSCPQG